MPREEQKTWDGSPCNSHSEATLRKQDHPIGLQRTIDRPLLVEDMYTLNHLIFTATTPGCQVGQCPDKIDLYKVDSLASYQAKRDIQVFR